MTRQATGRACASRLAWGRVPRGPCARGASPASRAAFSLMELVVVAGIIVALLALTFALYRRVQNQAETAESRERMELIRNSLGGYFVEHGAYPAGLSAVLASLPISIPRNTDGEPLDPWGHPYSYTSTTNPAGERLVYNLSSPGPTDDPGDDLVMGP